MPHRLVSAAAGVLLLLPLAACGSSKDDAGAAQQASGLSGVSLTGKVGESVSARWKSKVTTPKKESATTLVQGKGDKIASGDTVSTYLWIGNGTTKKTAYSDYQQGAAEDIPASTSTNAVLARLFKGATYGSRVATVTTGTALLGSSSGSSQLGIDGTDTLVVVADFVKKAATSPTPSDAKVHTAKPGTMPTVVSTKGKPTGLSWKGVAKPALTTPVQRQVLKQGTGAAVKATDTITANYLGATYQATKPFDESYSKGQPLTSQLSGLVKGWSIALTGVKVGSRVLIQIPPAYGYGAQGSGSTIPKNATLWFVIDIKSAKAS